MLLSMLTVREAGSTAVRLQRSDLCNVCMNLLVFRISGAHRGLIANKTDLIGLLMHIAQEA